jgi:hypothetical protein
MDRGSAKKGTIKPFGSASTYRKGSGKGAIRSRALSAEMRELALLPQRESAGASESLPSFAIKCELKQSSFCDVSTGIQSAHTAFGEEPISFGESRFAD